METTKYTVSGMTCGHCETAVRSEVLAIPGVTDVEVSAATGDLTVSSAAPVASEAVIAAVDEAGYTATSA